MFLYFILFCLLAQWEGETNSCDCWPSKSIPLKVMRETVKRRGRKGDARRKREGQQQKWELEEGSLLKVEWTKELMCLFALNKGVSKPWPLQFCIVSE
jgi:hypothetical protein